MSELVAQAAEWFASTGAPNGLVVLALLTSPATWARTVRERVGPLIGRVLPGGSRQD